MVKIGLDAGHGENTYENTGGKGINGWEEYWFNEQATKHAYNRLVEHGFDVVLSQGWDKNDVSLQSRTNFLNAEDTDLNFSIHANAGPPAAEGACMFHWDGSEDGKKLANIWTKNFKEFCPEQGLHGDGIHESKVGSWTNFHMIRETEAVTNLIEHGFFTNPEQLKNLKNSDFQRRAAEAIVKSVCEYFDIKYKEGKTVSDKPDYIDHAYEKQIKLLKEKGIMQGYPNGDFGVDDKLTRGQFAVVIARLFEQDYLN